MKIEVKYAETMKQVITLVFIPLASMAVCMLLLFSIDLKQFSQTVETIIIYTFIIAALLFSIFTVLRIISIKATIEYDNQLVNIALNKKSFLYPNREFHFNYTNIENASLDEDAQARVFVTIKLKSPSKSILLQPVDQKKSDEFIAFWNDFSAKINVYNESNNEHPELKIKSKGFYDSTWVRVLAVFSVLLAVVLTVAKIADSDAIPTYKLIAFYCYAIPFSVSAYNAYKKSKNKEQ